MKQLRASSRKTFERGECAFSHTDDYSRSMGHVERRSASMAYDGMVLGRYAAANDK